MRIGELIKQYREAHSISMRDFAKRANISASYVAKLEADTENKTSLTIPKIGSIARALGITPDQLLKQMDDTKVDLSNKDHKDSPNVSFLGKSGPVIPIKVYGSVPAGVPVEAIEDIVDEVYIPESWTKAGQKFIGLRVKGSSMYPKYLDGDTVVVQLQDDCQSGQDCVVYVNGYEATLKTLFKESDGRIRLQPINPEYEPRYYGPTDDPVRLLGVVRQLIRAI